MAKGDFFSPNRKTSSKDKQVASSMSGGSYGGYVDAGERRGFVSKEQAESMLANPEAYKMRPSEIKYLRQSMPFTDKVQAKPFFSQELGQIASATSDLSGLLANKQPLSPIGSDDYNKEVEGFVKDMKDSFYYRTNFDLDTGERVDYKMDPIPGATPYTEDQMRKDYPFRRQFRYENWDGEKYTPGVPFGQKPKTEEKQNILQKVSGFLANAFTGTQPVAAGTLDANQQVSQVSERPKLSYVNPDAKTMSLGEIKEAFKPKNLFGYKDKFGRFDDPGSPLARDRAETMQRVAQNFSSPITADARTIGQIKADQDARMRENARLRNESFQRGERVQQKSADVTYGTNMLSNPAFGFRGKMTDAAKAKYDQSAKDATEMARTDPSLGNVAMQTFNRVSGFLGGPQASLESIGERQLRLANKEINRPRYQKEAYARKMLGITNDQLKARNMQQIQANAAARTQAFQNERVQRALEKAAVRRGENVGTGRDGGFGLGTSGQGMPSNPKGFSGYSRKSSPSTGTGTGTGQSRSNTGSKSSARGARGSTSSRSRGGTGTGKSSQGSKSSARGARGSAGSRGRGGTGTGGSKSNTGSKKSARRCDIRTKIDITSLTNQNLIKDDLATVAYFVQELRGE